MNSASVKSFVKKKAKRAKGIVLESAKEALIHYFSANKRLPSISEAAKIFGVLSKDTAFRIIKKLIDEGVVKKDAAGKLIPVNLNTGIKMLGLVEAGFATPAEENLLETITLDDYVIEHKERSFMLRVKGDSMQDAGIHDGDMVIVERGIEAKIGQIVIAEIDGGFTMKYLRKKGRVLYLEPANANYKPLFPKHDLKVVAIVKAVVRKYR